MVNGKGEAPVYVSYFVNGKTVERSTEVFVPVTWCAFARLLFTII